MIYISSSCVKHKKIKDSVQELVENGFTNIELSGGTAFYDGIEEDLLELKDKYNLNYICHNYFPPPKEEFVLNLASLDDEVYEKTFHHLIKSIELSKKLGAKKFGFHAGFFIDIKVSEIGKKISKDKLYDRDSAIDRFCNKYRELKKKSGELELYIENNVFSAVNHKTYGGEQIFMLCNYDDYVELKEKLEFKLLLDVAHLKVSSNTLGLSFQEELNKMIELSDYLHISDNNGLSDQNMELSDRLIMNSIRSKSNKTCTLELYEPISKIVKNYEMIKEAVYE